jgi:hypothetical protein
MQRIIGSVSISRNLTRTFNFRINSQKNQNCFHTELVPKGVHIKWHEIEQRIQTKTCHETYQHTCNETTTQFNSYKKKLYHWSSAATPILNRQIGGSIISTVMI